MDIDNFQYVLSDIINKYASDYKYSDCSYGTTIDCAFSEGHDDSGMRKLVVQMTDDTKYEVYFKRE